MYLQNFRKPEFIRVATLAALVLIAGCTEEARNKLSRSADNFLGENLKVSYIDNGVVVKTWTVKDGKITTGKGSNGEPLGYYFFWSIETGYVQLPVERTVIEEIKN